jgi:hypothetical protein
MGLFDLLGFGSLRFAYSPTRNKSGNCTEPKLKLPTKQKKQNLALDGESESEKPPSVPKRHTTQTQKEF